MKAKHQLLLTLTALLTVMTVSSCVSCDYRQSTTTVGRNLPLKNFEKIVILGSTTVFYTQGDSFSVEVRGKQGLADKIECEVNGNVLTIRNKNKIGIFNFSLGSDDEVAVYVTSPDLTSVALSGSGDFICTRKVDTDNLDITLRGSGDISFDDIICNECRTELVGSGDISVKRLDCLKSQITLVGSGDVSVRQWNVKNTEISLRGSGDVDVAFEEGCEDADATVTGSGDICLKGRLKHWSGNKHGSGDIDITSLSVD